MKDFPTNPKNLHEVGVALRAIHVALFSLFKTNGDLDLSANAVTGILMLDDRTPAHLVRLRPHWDSASGAVVTEWDDLGVAP